MFEISISQCISTLICILTIFRVALKANLKILMGFSRIIKMNLTAPFILISTRYKKNDNTSMLQTTL